MSRSAAGALILVLILVPTVVAAQQGKPRLAVITFENPPASENSTISNGSCSTDSSWTPRTRSTG